MTWVIGVLAAVALVAAMFLSFVGGIGLVVMLVIGIGITLLIRRVRAGTRRSSPS